MPIPPEDVRCTCGTGAPCPLHPPDRTAVVDDAADARKVGCVACGESYDPSLSDAGDPSTYCSAECEAGDIPW